MKITIWIIATILVYACNAQTKECQDYVLYQQALDAYKFSDKERTVIEFGHKPSASLIELLKSTNIVNEMEHNMLLSQLESPYSICEEIKTEAQTLEEMLGDKKGRKQYTELNFSRPFYIFENRALIFRASFAKVKGKSVKAAGNIVAIIYEKVDLDWVLTDIQLLESF